MGVFVVLVLIPLLVQHCVIGKKHVDVEKKNRNALLVFFFIFTVLIALRHESVGADTFNYINYFDRYADKSWSELASADLEIGFAYYVKIISLLTSEAQVFFAITAVITIAMIYPTYRRMMEDPSLSIVLFCTMSTFVLSFSGIRQMIAIGIGFFAYECVRNKKLIWFIVCVWAAMLFHISAFMLIFMYPLYYVKITKKWLLAVVPTLLVIFVFNRQIFTVLSMLLMRYTKYDATISQTGAYTMIVLFVAFAVFSFLVSDDEQLDDETIGLRNFLLFSVVIQMFAPLHTLAMRMNYYYIIFIPLLIPKIVAYRSERWEQVAVVARHVMVVFFFLYFFVILSGDGSLNVVPYHFFWENVV